MSVLRTLFLLYFKRHICAFAMKTFVVKTFVVKTFVVKLSKNTII